MLEPFGRVVRDLQLRSPTVPIISNVTGKLATADELTTAEYWVLHARRTVRFYEAVQTLERTGTEIFLELGPQAVEGIREELERSLQGIAPGRLSLPCIRRSRGKVEPEGWTQDIGIATCARPFASRMPSSSCWPMAIGFSSRSVRIRC